MLNLSPRSSSALHSLLVFVAVVVSKKQCLAGAPQITIGLNTAAGTTSKLGGIEPQVRWQTSGTCNGCDVAGGIDVTIQDVDQFKESIWGKVSKKVKGFGYTAGAKLSVKEPKNIDLDFQCDTPTDARIQVLASTTDKGKKGVSVSVDKLKVVQGIDSDFGAIVAAPTYDVKSGKGDLSLAFARDDTSSFQVDINTDKDAKVTYTRRLGDDSIISPSITNQGQFQLTYDRRMDFGTLSTTYKPNHHIEVKLSDGPWQATFLAPMNEYHKLTQGVKVSVKTKVDVDLDSILSS